MSLQKGFTLIAAIFLLVVVAALVGYMTNIRVVQQTTLLYGVQGARAMQAARSGVEWGIHESIVNSKLWRLDQLHHRRPFAGFSVEVQCVPDNPYRGRDADRRPIQLTAIASSWRIMVRSITCSVVSRRRFHSIHPRRVCLSTRLMPKGFEAVNSDDRRTKEFVDKA